MKITVHSCTDQLGSFKGNKNFGIDDVGYERAMEWLNKHQEYRGGERYEYFGVDWEIKFMWDMREAEFKALMAPIDENTADGLSDYLGAVFFGNFKLEFIRNNITTYCNLFQYGADDGNECGPYAYLDDGTPYEERYPACDEIRHVPRRTFRAFAENIERQIIDLLNRHPEYIEEAIQPTDPTQWYPDGQCVMARDIVRTA